MLPPSPFASGEVEMQGGGVSTSLDTNGGQNASAPASTLISTGSFVLRGSRRIAASSSPIWSQITSSTLSAKPVATVAVFTPARAERSSPTSGSLATRSALRVASDPLVGELLSALAGVNTATVATGFADKVDDVIWDQIGLEEAAIRRDPRSTNDPVLISVLAGADAF